MEYKSIVWPKPADDIIRYSALVYQKGLVSAAGGNVSARLGGDMRQQRAAAGSHLRRSCALRC